MVACNGTRSDMCAGYALLVDTTVVGYISGAGVSEVGVTVRPDKGGGLSA